MHESNSRHTLSFLVCVFESQSISIVIVRTYLRKRARVRREVRECDYIKHLPEIPRPHRKTRTSSAWYLVLSWCWWWSVKHWKRETLPWSKFHARSKRNELQRCEAAFRFPYLNIFPYSLCIWYKLRHSKHVHTTQFFITNSKNERTDANPSTFFHSIPHWRDDPDPATPLVRPQTPLYHESMIHSQNSTEEDSM